MDTADFLHQLVADGALLRDTAAHSDLDVPVPGIDWSLRDVVAHTGAVHRWAADLVRRALQSNETGGSAAFRPDLPDDELAAWFGDGVTALVTTLADAPPDLEVWAFGKVRPARRFWARRQAREPAIHRADAQAAAGVPVSSFPAAFAADGLAELFGFARGFPGGRPGRLAFRTIDGDEWLVTFGGERVEAAASPQDLRADATVTGRASDLYLWAWNRPSAAVVAGDDTVAAEWRQVRIT